LLPPQRAPHPCLPFVKGRCPSLSRAERSKPLGRTASIRSVPSPVGTVVLDGPQLPAMCRGSAAKNSLSYRAESSVSPHGVAESTPPARPPVGRALAPAAKDALYVPSPCRGRGTARGGRGRYPICAAHTTRTVSFYPHSIRFRRIEIKKDIGRNKDEHRSERSPLMLERKAIRRSRVRHLCYWHRTRAKLAKPQPT